MLKPETNIPPPVRPQITASLRQLKRGESLFFDTGSPATIQAVISRLKRDHEGARDYTSQWQGNGLRVWRLK